MIIGPGYHRRVSSSEGGHSKCAMSRRNGKSSGTGNTSSLLSDGVRLMTLARSGFCHKPKDNPPEADGRMKSNLIQRKEGYFSGGFAFKKFEKLGGDSA